MSTPYSMEKSKELIKYLAYKSVDDPFLGRTKLFKLIFFCDFYAYRKIGDSITGQKYHKEAHGPVSDSVRDLIAELKNDGEIVEVPVDLLGYEQRRYVCMEEPNVEVFSSKETSLIDDVINRYFRRTACDISQISHDEIPAWDDRSNSEELPIALALITKTEPDDEVIEHGKELVQRIKRGEFGNGVLST